MSTGNFTGNANVTPGYQWLGGILLQWGYVNGTHGASNVFVAGDTNTASFVNPLNQDVYPSIDNTYTLGETQYREWSSVVTRMVTGNNNRMVLRCVFFRHK